MDDFRRRLKSLRGDMSQREFGKMLDINHSLISDYETGRTFPSMGILSKLISKLSLNINWLLTGEGEMYTSKEEGYILRDAPSKNIRLIPIVGSIACGIPIKEWKGYGDKYEPMLKVGHLGNPFLLRASGDSMKPYILPGDLLLFSDNIEYLKEGRPAAISFKAEPETQESYVKLIKFSGKDAYLTYSYDPDYKPTIVKRSEVYKMYPLIKIIREIK